MNVLGHEPAKCCGCGLCTLICPTNALEMEFDSEGFAYPKPTGHACIQCGDCVRCCPVLQGEGERQKNTLEQGSPSSIWAMQCKDTTIRKSSASGGVFSMLAAAIIRQGGYVYGAAFDECWKVRHIEVDSLAGLEKLRSSKYAQSDLQGVFKQVKGRLDAGKTVLFSGVPCQTAALLNYLGDRVYGNLYCVDLFCHGISSPVLFEKYLQETVGDTDRIRGISFRDKSIDWERYQMKITLTNGTYEKPYARDAFLKAFCRSVSLRPSCYHCKLKGFPRQSNITLGDFWRVDSMARGLNDHLGTSLVFINDEKGDALFQSVSKEGVCVPVDRTVLQKYYPGMGKPVAEPEKRTVYFHTVTQKRVSKGMKYCRLPMKTFVKKHLRYMLVRLKMNRVL